MRRELTITPGKIDEAACLALRHMPPEAGAAVCFSGVVRGDESGRRIAAIEYEAFEAMALRQFEILLDKAASQWPVISVRLVHRVGRIEVGEPSLWVEVIAPHRGEAFAACQFIIDEMKREVPIWKKPLPH